ncbi:MAG: YncE family protein, partial [Candidatus Acidiferrales bacterium]
MTRNNQVPALCLFLILSFAAARPVAAGTSRIYVTNSAGDTVSVVDPVTNKVVQVISGIEVPHGVNFSHDGKQVYISNESESVLDIVDQKSGKILHKVPLSGHPNNIAVTKDGQDVLVCIATAPGALDVVDTASMKVIKIIPVKGPLHNVYVTPDGKFAVAGSVVAKRLTVVDLKTMEPAWDISFEGGVRPMAIDTNADGSTRQIFVQLSNLHGFVVVDFAKHQEVSRVNLPEGPFGKEEWRLGTPSHGIAVAPDGKTLWVNSVLANAVFEYSLPDLKLLGHAALPVVERPGKPSTGAVPEWITFTPDSKTAYVSDSAT